MFGVLHALGLAAYRIGVHLAALVGHPKAKKAVKGRRGWEDRIARAARSAGPDRQGEWIHLHCASFGEFEQGAPVLDALRERAPERPILLTFFSPSGIESVPPDVADHVDYLPLDSPRAMRRFHTLIPAADTVLIKYELWPGLLSVRLESGCRVHLVAARFDRGRFPANRWGAGIRSLLSAFTTVQVQDDESKAVMARFGVVCDITGDPRVDRVLDTASKPVDDKVQTQLNRLSTWIGERKLLIVGSAWPGEWQALQGCIGRREDWCFLVAPHEVGSPAVSEWASASGFPRTSLHRAGNLPPSEGLILDEVGLLKHAYRLGTIAVVGGGWGAGVHNTLEPAAFGLPIAVGPATEGFREIDALQAEGALHVCHASGEMADLLRTWMAPESTSILKEKGAIASRWVTERSGAAHRIADRILGTGAGR